MLLIWKFWVRTENLYPLLVVDRANASSTGGDQKSPICAINKEGVNDKA